MVGGAIADSSACWPRGEEVLTVIMITVMEQTPPLLAGLIATSTSAWLGDGWNAGGLAAGALGGPVPFETCL